MPVCTHSNKKTTSLRKKSKPYISSYDSLNIGTLRSSENAFFNFSDQKMIRIVKLTWFFHVTSCWEWFSIATICFFLQNMRYQWWVWGFYILLIKKLSIFVFRPESPKMTQIPDLVIFSFWRYWCTSNKPSTITVSCFFCTTYEETSSKWPF